MDSLIQSSLINSPGNHGSNGYSITSPKKQQPFPSPSPSASDGADDSLLPVPPTFPLSPPLPESTSPKKRTAAQATFSDERCDMSRKRVRNSVKSMTPISQTSCSTSAEENSTSSATQTPKKPRLSNRDIQPPSDKKVQRSSNKDLNSPSEKRSKRDKVSKSKVDEQPKEVRRRRPKKEEYIGKEDKNERNEELAVKCTPRKNKCATEVEKRARSKLQHKGTTRNKKEISNPPAIGSKRKRVYAEEDTTETDDCHKSKQNCYRRENLDYKIQQKDIKQVSAKVENCPATPESSLDNEPKPVYVERKGGVGLLNLGNTCFGNSIIQAWCNTPGFRDLLMRHQYSWSKQKDRNTNYVRKSAAAAPARRTRRAARMIEEKEKNPVPNDASLCSELGELFHCMTYNQGDAVAPTRSATALSPHEFCDIMTAVLPMFERYSQHDAQEFFQLALQRMSKELVLEEMGTFGHPGAIDNVVCDISPIDTLFGGECINTNQCNGCSYSTTNIANPEAFLSLGLGIPIAPEEQEHAKGRKSSRTKQAKAISLESCLEHYSSPEVVYSEDEKYKAGNEAAKVPFCSNCGPKEGITKTLKLAKCSQYLCVHLKRFQWNNGRPYKINTIVQPPMEELDIAPYMAEGAGVENTKYRLHTVVVHEGDMCDSGHYIAYNKHDDGSWWKKNDDKISKVSAEEVANKQAYMLFFTRNDVHVSESD